VFIRSAARPTKRMMPIDARRPIPKIYAEMAMTSIAAIDVTVIVTPVRIARCVLS